MNATEHSSRIPTSPQTTRVKFWNGNEADINLSDILRSAVPVKGVSCPRPLRFLELYANHAEHRDSPDSGARWREIKARFFPRISGVTVELGDKFPQPPFTWRDADPQHLAVSFTYNANAFFRIIKNLSNEGRVPNSKVEALVDDACLLLTQIYQANDFFLIKNINNNFNMYLISKVVEVLVGKRCYDSERQELSSTRRSLNVALSLLPEQAAMSAIEKMGTALGRGVSFIESRVRGAELGKHAISSVQEASFQFFNTRLAIDDREKLISNIAAAGHRKNDFELVVIFDDAAETVDDLLWLQDLLCLYPFLRVHLLVNTVQVSINFSEQMFSAVRRNPTFRRLFSLPPERLRITPVYCPFISFQTNFLPPKARRILDRSDAVFIKGANFFETCQIPEKDTYYGFVVYGPISRACSGLNDFDGVFAHVPAGKAGYKRKSGLGFAPLTNCVAEEDATPMNVQARCRRASS